MAREAPAMSPKRGPHVMLFYIVMVNVNPGLTIQDIQTALTNNIQWYRIANNVWVVHTNAGSAWLHQRLIPLAHPSGTLFISRLNVNDRQGWLPQGFWTWIDGRINQYGTGA